MRETAVSVNVQLGGDGMRPGLNELLIVLAIVLLLFGAKRVPELARSLGRSLKEFKRGREEGESDADEAKDGTKPPLPTA